MNIKTFWMLVIMFIIGSFFHLNVKKIQKKFEAANPQLVIPKEKKPFFSFLQKKKGEEDGEEDAEEETIEDI